MQIPNQNSWFLCNRPDGPLKASWRPAVSRSFSVEDVRTSRQHCSDPRSSFSNFYSELDFSRQLFGKFLQDVRTTWQLVRTLSCIPKYSGFPLRARKGVIVKTVRTLGQAVRKWTCYGKNCAILERRSQKTVWTWTYYEKNCAILERQLQKAVRKRLSSVRTLHSQSPNLSRIRFSLSL
jgi:hypothetical protein